MGGSYGERVLLGRGMLGEEKKGRMGSGEWLEKALLDLCGRIETGLDLDLDADIISGLVSYCELAPPEDAREYLNNIIGEEVGQNVIQEYLQRRGFVGLSNSSPGIPESTLQPYIKPPVHDGLSIGSKKPTRAHKEGSGTHKEGSGTGARVTKYQNETSEPRSITKGTPGVSKKKKSGKVISLAEAAKGSIVFQQGKPCSCQARRHKLVSNCSSCGKVVCEQEGEGPCSFCGALVLREGSTYAGLDDTVVPVSDVEVAAEALAKRLVEYDRNSAARTTVIDDQSDYYEFEGNSWLSKEEKDLLMKKQKEIVLDDERRRNKLIVTFDLLGRKVMLNEDDASELESQFRILRPPEERELNRIKPNPTVSVQPIFVGGSSARNPVKGKKNTRVSNGLCLEISGRLQHDNLQRSITGNQNISATSEGESWNAPSVSSSSHIQGESYECSLDYN